MSRYAVGVDIGGTRTKMGLVELRLGKVFPVKVFDTCRESEEIFLDSMRKALKQCLQEENVKEDELAGVGVSIGSYVFSDGTIDGMSCFVPFMTEGYPLRQRLETAFSLPVRADNDVRLIGLAESLYGAGRGYRRTLTMTLGSGIGIGVCVDGAPLGNEAFCHLAGHVKVRVGGEFPALDKEPCYCGIKGCLESTCSGTSFEKYLRFCYGPDMDNEKFFQLALKGDPEAAGHLEWYLDMLAEALNQYIYTYCPDVIILGGGLAKGLAPWKTSLEGRLKAKVHFRQKTDICISSLMEDSGVLGAALLYGQTA
ncbi:MAG: ROK family protein [Ruminococcus sp.]|nr:ROK family protein [Ruminococcus sp.]